MIDNGAGKLKAGTCKNSTSIRNEITPVKQTNCTARMIKQMNILIGDDVDKCVNGSLLHYNRPFDRGYLVNWQCEIDIWSKLFSSNRLNVNPSESSLCVTDSPFTPEQLQNDMNEVVFEEYSFQEYLRKPAAWFSAYEYQHNPPEGAINPSCCTVIDSGFSFTHAMPFIDGKCRKSGVKRVNVGGKLLTNYLKEVVSYRQWNMMDEFKIIDQVKKDLCYISHDFNKELYNSKRTPGSSQIILDTFGENLKKFFVLPDYQKIMRGNVKKDNEEAEADEQILSMETERFSIPEVLFSPSDVGINQAGIAEATWQSLQTLNQVEMGLAAGNILLTGGNTKFPQFKKRFFNEIRPLIPDIHPVRVCNPPDPDMYAFKGMSNFIQNEIDSNTLRNHMVSREMYLENGHDYCNKKFYNSW